ncbi:hypothetical protein K6959_00990 [Bacillus aquiflavi]|uniref:hypothetical protein n=1 Tax=Bacillus aquiflavi TaxID=2672567 RepID=UPI001CAA1A48|nr:hypothetical protein K6959_00990 [Bacillus aquiflavi]
MQLVDDSQTNCMAVMIDFFKKKILNKKVSLSHVADQIDKHTERFRLDSNSPYNGHPGNLALSRKHGTPMIKLTLARITQRYIKLAKVHRIQAKGLRHSHASYFINEFNVSVLILFKRMGHSSPKITLKLFTYVWLGVDELIAEEMTGNINIQTAAKTGISFNDNRAEYKSIDSHYRS